jgi:hypothetical protein
VAGYNTGAACTTCSYNVLIGYQVWTTNLTNGTGNLIIDAGNSPFFAPANASSTLFLGADAVPSLSCTAIATTPVCAFPSSGGLTLGVASSAGGSLILEGSSSGSATLTGGTAGVLTSSAAVAFSNASIVLSGLANSTAAQTGTVCWAASGLTYDNTSTCLVSSARFKHDVEPLSGATRELMAMRPVTFLYNGDKTDYVHFGLVAEELSKIDPRLVVNDNVGRPLKVKYLDAIALLIRGFQEQEREIVQLRRAR